MNSRILKYILDIESVILEIEEIKDKCKNDFKTFKSDFILKRAIEPDLEIIGEAVKHIISIDPTITISSTKNIFGLQNLITHAYDSIEDELVWGIIQKDIPILKNEIDQLIN